MTSKEALEIIIKENKKVSTIYVGCRSDLYTKLGVEFDIIRRDLEVLEEIRSHVLCTSSGNWYVDIQESDYDYKSECTKEEWENSIQKKIKDWLREKHN